MRSSASAVAASVAVLALGACTGPEETSPERRPSAESPAVVVTIDPDAPLDPQLKRAAQHNDVDAMSSLILLGVDVDADLGAGLRPLHIAAVSDSTDVVVLLLVAGAKVDARADNGATALYMASGAAGYDTVWKRLAAGADATVPMSITRDVHPIHNAASQDNVGAVQALLDFGIDIDSHDPTANSATPLLMAAFSGAPRAVELLLERGADPTIADSTGRTPYAWANAQGDAAVVEAFHRAGIDS